MFSKINLKSVWRKNSIMFWKHWIFLKLEKLKNEKLSTLTNLKMYLHSKLQWLLHLWCFGYSIPVRNHLSFTLSRNARFTKQSIECWINKKERNVEKTGRGEPKYSIFWLWGWLLETKKIFDLIFPCYIDKEEIFPCTSGDHVLVLKASDMGRHKIFLLWLCFLLFSF